MCYPQCNFFFLFILFVFFFFSKYALATFSSVNFMFSSISMSPLFKPSASSMFPQFIASVILVSNSDCNNFFIQHQYVRKEFVKKY